MTATRTIDVTNSDDIIDLRDVTERVEQLEAEIEADEISEDNGAEPQLDDDGNTRVEMATCGECGKSWNDALVSGRTPAPSARCPYESIHDEIAELATLAALLDELAGSGGDHDWRGTWYPGSLIRDSYFKDYAMELADDIGAINSDARWPNNCIDWDKATRELRMDYSSVEYGDVTYWYR